MRFATILHSFVLAYVLASLAGCGSAPATPPVADKKEGADSGKTVIQITDTNVAGEIETMRTSFQHDAAGRRTGNQVLDGKERLIATEKLTYDSDGRLSERSYFTVGERLKWRWSDFEYNENGHPVRNEIHNSDGKLIGWYEWKYLGEKLDRRYRFDGDGSLRFYYADILFDAEGNYATWTKFDAGGNKIGHKTWKYPD